MMRAGDLVICMEPGEFAPALLEVGRIYRIAKVFGGGGQVGLGLEEVPESVVLPPDGSPPGFAASRFAPVRQRNTAWVRAFQRWPPTSVQLAALEWFDQALLSVGERAAFVLAQPGERICEGSLQHRLRITKEALDAQFRLLAPQFFSKPKKGDRA